MKKTLLLLASALLWLPAAQAEVQAKPQKTETESLRRQLGAAGSPADSLAILYDILDLSPRDDYKQLAREIYGVAERAGDMPAQLDIIRQVTAVIKEDKDYETLEKAVKRLPPSDERMETLLFVRMKRLSYKTINLSEEERQKEIARIIAEYDWNKPEGKHERLLNLFTLVEYLRNDASGDMLEKYLDELFRQATSSDFSLYAVPNIIFAEAANAYSMAEDHAKAVQADKKLLEVISGLEKKYAGKGRKHRNYDVSKYVCYRRMLRNFEALQPGEADMILAKIKEIASVLSLIHI